MPRFYFDIDDGERQVGDEDGLVLLDVEAACNQAIAVLPEIARDHLPSVDRLDFVSVVRDERGEPVFRARLSFTAEWLR